MTKHKMPPKEELEELYLNQNLSIRELGLKYNVSNSVMGRWVKNYGLVKTEEQIKTVIEKNRVKVPVKERYLAKKKKELIGNVIADQEILEFLPNAYSKQYGWRVKYLKCSVDV